MKRNPIVGSLRQCLLVFILVCALAPAAEASAQPAPENPGATSPAAGAAGCQWTYYPISGGHLQTQQPLYNDPDNTPIIDLSTGNPFRANATFIGSLASLASTGSIDFNGDNKTDVFRTAPRSDGNLQWQYSSAGMGAWHDLAYAGPELPTSSALQFGDFNGDGRTDVFATQFADPTYYWNYSPSGLASFVNLHTTTDFADRLALGDFNADGVTDVFTASVQDSIAYWGYFSGGMGNVHSLAHAGNDPALLRFGDFNGDGNTDVFAGSAQPDGSTQWQYSEGGALSYVTLLTTTVPYSELKFGDFNGDGKTDVLAALPQNDGGLQVIYWPGGLGPAVNVGHVAAPAPALRVGDFNGDGTDDLLALRCGMSAPLAFGPLQTLANSGYATFAHHLLGDVNGDGLPDVILVSTCQNPNAFGICASHHLQVGAALATPAHTHTLVAPQQLSADDFTYARAFAGDFNGDGKTDLALVLANGNSLTLYLARSNGDGHFTLGAPQTFGGEADWGIFNPLVGDFYGNGHDNLAFTTVCNTVALEAGSCTNGDNNYVYLATVSGGVFSLGARQDLLPPDGLPTGGWGTYYTFAGDFNGDGKTDLVFNSTCQKTNSGDSGCTGGTANEVYTALSNGHGGFTMSARQTYGGSGWGDYPDSTDLVGDVNGDGRSDLVWSSVFQAVDHTHNNLAVVGLANSDGSFQLGATQDFSDTWTGYPSLVDLNRDGKADLVWNNAPLANTDVDTFAAATSNGDGTFHVLGPGAVYTSLGYFSLPENDAAGRVPTSLTLLSNQQNSISSALFVVEGGLRSIYLPFAAR